MATGAKIGIVLGLLLVVICFVRILDRDISEEVSNVGDDGSLALVDPPSGENPSDGFSTLGEGDLVDSPEDSNAQDSNTQDASAQDSGDRSLDPAPPPAGNGDLKPAGLRSVRDEDREAGFVGRTDPMGSVDDEPGDLPATGLSGDDATIATGPPDPASRGELTSGGVADDPSVVAVDPNDPWPIGGDTGEGLTSPEELFRLMQGEDGGSGRPNLGLGPEPTPEPAEVASGPSEIERGAAEAEATIPVNRSTTTSDFPRTHTVVEFDTLWDLASAYYGKPLLYKEIIKANPPMTETSALRVGTKITIPAPPESVAAARPRPVSTPADDSSRAGGSRSTYTVVKGDNLYKIAERLLGKGDRWKDIAQVNPDLDPDRLKIGAVLTLPK